MNWMKLFLKTNDLDGFLSLDLKKTPEDKRAEALKKTMNFSNVNMKAIYNGDFIDQRVRPPMNNVDPTSNVCRSWRWRKYSC